jgi:DNA-binding transcriptional LysR family regulator
MDARIVPDLLVFREVVEQGSITRAARKLHTVQSNVTARIKKLETEFGQALFHRHARGVKMTPAAKRLLPLVMKLDALLLEIKSHASSGSYPVRGSLRIGSIETVAALQLTPLLAKFGTIYPGIDISLQTGGSVDLISRLAAGELDMAFVSGPIRVEGIEQELMFEDTLSIAAPLGMDSIEDFSKPKATGLKILFQRPDCSYTQKMESLLREKDIHLARAMQFGALDGILSCVQAGIGIAALPKTLIEESKLKGSISEISLPKDISSIETYLIQRRQQEKSGAIEAFSALLREARHKLPVNEEGGDAFSTLHPVGDNRAQGIPFPS